MAEATCSIDGCVRRAEKRTWCSAHYKRWRRHGDPLAGQPPVKRGLTPDQRFWAKVDKAGPISAHRPDLGPCWLWTAAVNTAGTGYGTFAVTHGRMVGAHRYAYEREVGPIPPKYHVDHLCRVTLCVRPSHLEAVTPRVNILRGEAPSAKRRRATHCRRGHPFNEANAHISAAGKRRCRACTVIYTREMQKRIRAEVAMEESAPCPLSRGRAGDECEWCAGYRPERKVRFCSAKCRRTYEANHSRNASRRAARERDGHRCVRCGSTEDLEVNHIEPVKLRQFLPGCHHHLDGLETLCQPCHVATSRDQREAAA